MRKVKIASFLKERKLKFKPVDANSSGLNRIEKINFNGDIFLAPIQTNTDMILVKNGDLVISGINVEKGALAIYHGADDVLASIHYSAYEFDDSKIDISYLKWFLKSSIFRTLLLAQTGGGIKKEIKAKHLLPIEIMLPSLDRQREIVRKIQLVSDDIESLSSQVFNNSISVSNLRQSILQQAVEGKLVAQDETDEPASVLLERIRAEKERLIAEKKIKKQKELPGITDAEKPFDLPQGWAWCRLGDSCELTLGKMLDERKNKGNLTPYLRNLNVKWFHFNLSDVATMPITCEEKERFFAQKGDLLICEGGYPGTAAIWAEDTSIAFQKALHRGRFYFPHMNKFLLYFLFLSYHSGNLKNYYTGAGIQHLTGKSLKSIPLPLPPLAEQQRIVEKVDKLMAVCDALEQEVANAKKYASQLMEAVLQEAFAAPVVAKKENVIAFTPKAQNEPQPLLAAARGSMREDTWNRLAARAVELANEDN